jgi:hypothetical protein
MGIDREWPTGCWDFVGFDFMMGPQSDQPLLRFPGRHASFLLRQCGGQPPGFQEKI